MAFLARFGIKGDAIFKKGVPVALLLGECVIVGCVIGGTVSYRRSTKCLKPAVQNMISHSKENNGEEKHNQFMDFCIDLLKKAKMDPSFMKLKP